ncbi:conserved Plasmodium protein, unknown function [Plasmodium knowlesi strain H]|uniref:Uncharacterized protein n=3 Tax=Plasmodium knowlesi TaxID=5850 RepID=A0A5K1U1Q9_PLAKH|nr:conserved Plasmodium protein, unknown function [Plasmodium knowlesi strain H]OTN66050.1 Uncharacterized protein PKNOH_S100057800 [Plasmodium knowlesi]CAA9987935.1 conserved Plasmodium protein, unknown function [Plasmodium knowlesi strain H]SBO22210.1 conserved Plasmodium protein, unknown function [Plasmodium knowlesi strain H]SBO28868.1 conserved Plasmodium protein, unknown function [Plasmodium knowlesi strain H]VVS77409.1 conserved Plasmodium protein, unknown function [Plasmodium knowlesi |eukprot:XP_002258916.1 hypothetical protein, conserved in Plasmodium species [Plasmodium knowlesi strain H]
MTSGNQNGQATDEAEEENRDDLSISPNEEEGNAEGGDSSERCAVEYPLGESQGEIKVRVGNKEAKEEKVAKENEVMPPHKDATSYEATLQKEDGCANSDNANKDDTKELVIQEKGEGQSIVQLNDGENATGENRYGESATGENATGENATGESATGESATGESATEDAPLSDISFSEDFFDQASQFQKAPEDPKEQNPNQLADLYKEMKKCEDLFLSHFDCTGDDSKTMEMIRIGVEANEERQEKKCKVNIPQINFTSMEAISQFMVNEDMYDNDDPPIERQLFEHVKQFTQEQKKKNKKNKMNKYYLGVRSYLNTLPPSMHQKIFREYRKNF